MVKNKKSNIESSVSSLGFGGISMKYKKEREKILSSAKTKKQREYEKPSVQERLAQSKKAERKEKIERLGNIVGRIEKRLLSGKLLKKPKAKLPSTDPKGFITRGLGKPKMVSEGRTGYFNSEMMEETKWLS